tara:strand:+ start:3860 stop:4588 length:729 start_codon:yes stop_codon:yes gene_type:complete
MNYASINNVYSIVKDILNKSQMGFITPQQYNVFAPQAQKELTEELLELLLAPMVKYRLQSLETASGGIEASHRDDLSTLFVYNELQTAALGTNVFNYPDRYMYIDNITYKGKEVDRITPREAVYIVNNYYTPPTDSNPIAVMANNQIEIQPTNINDDIALTYYKNPMGSQLGQPVNLTPSWQYTLVGEDLLYNSASSVDFELPKSVEQKLAYKVLSLAGFSIRESQAVDYANVQEQKDKSTE